MTYWEDKRPVQPVEEERRTKTDVRPRVASLTQKGLTATCPVCDGMGCVIAQQVYDGSESVTMNVDGESKRVYVNPLAEVLIPCPGCFSDSAILTMGL